MPIVLKTCARLFVAVLLAGSAAFAETEKSLVAYYPFDEGQGTVAADKSGNGNHGIIRGAQWVKSEKGHALKFNGRTDLVEVPHSPSLNMGDSPFTIALWMKPDDMSTAMDVISKWSTRAGTEFALRAGGAYGNKLILFLSHWRRYRYSTGGVLKVGEWTHLGYVKRHDNQGNVYLNCYVDGEDRTGGIGNEPFRQEIMPGREKLYIGHLPGYGYFNGIIDEVRVYRGALSPEEVLRLYKTEGPVRGKNMAIFSRVGLEAHACPVPGKIVALLDARRMQPFADGTALRADLCRPGARKPIRRLETRDIPKADSSEVIFDVQELPAGSYVIHAAAIGPDGARIGEESSVTVEWRGRPAAFKNVKILNNLCWELLNVSGKCSEKQTFALPCDRWVFIRSSAQVSDGGEIRVGIDSDAADAAVIVQPKGAESTLETMRYLKAGAHAVHIRQEGKAELKHLVVRAIPALQYAFYGSDPHVKPYGPYDWNFLEKDVLPNINVMLSGIDDYYPREDALDRLKEWHKTGRSWIGYSPKGDAKSVEEVYGHWAKSPGIQHPLTDGLILDEFGGGDDPIYDVYCEAVKRIYANPEFKGKMILPYVTGGFDGKNRSSEFVRACIEGGGYICWEVYLPEQPTASGAAAVIRSTLSDEMARWADHFPGIAPRTVCVLAYMSQPTESLNINPAVDFKVHMEMQIRHLATHPAFFGLGGIQQYHASYSDEENVRWASRLYRHYAIEGNTEPLTKDPYELTHIENPDFAESARGWVFSSGEEQSIQVKRHAGYSHLQGRYPMTSMGDTFLWTKRSAARPNRFSQEIKNLEPGRLYSMKMITGDYQDLVKEKSDKKKTAVFIKLDNVEILPGPKTSFQFPFGNHPGHELGKFKGWGHRYWMNYHWRVFRARANTAGLSISDWKSEKEPGGAPGQELIYNFIEIQPYCE